MKSEGGNGQLPQWFPLSSGPFSTEIQVEPERSEPLLCSESPGDSPAPPQGGSEHSRSRQETAGVEGLLHASILTTRGEDWASQGQPKGKAEIPVVTRESGLGCP